MVNVMADLPLRMSPTVFVHFFTVGTRRVP